MSKQIILTDMLQLSKSHRDFGHSDRGSDSGPGVQRPGFIFSPHPDELHGVEEIVEGVGSVPELVLPPQAGGDRQEGKLIHVRAVCDQESGVPGRESEAPAPKKPSSVQSTSSIVSFRQVATSCSNSL